MDEILFWGLFFSGNKILEDWQKKNITIKRYVLSLWTNLHEGFTFSKIAHFGANS